VNLQVTVYMDRRDVTQWCESVSWGNAAHEIYRNFSLTFKGWHSITPGASWDIYGTRDPLVPRSEVLIRNGVIPPDRQPVMTFEGDELRMTVNGYDWSWMAQRRCPSDTIVIASSRKLARWAIEKAAGPVGRWRWIPTATLHDAVQKLGSLAGFTCELRIPNFRISAQVLDPTKSYWQSILDLTECLAPEYLFRRTENRVLITDRVARLQGVGSTMVLSEAAIKGIEAGPSVFRYVRRVLIEVPRWL
jgi:hypothetical protein